MESEGTTAPWFNILRCVLFGITAILIIGGNTVCLLVLRRVKKIHAVTRLFMASLAASDLLNGIFVTTPLIVSSAMDRWPYGEVACDIYGIGKYLCYYSGLFSLIAVTVERYIMVVAPLRYQHIVTIERAWKSLIGIWGLSIAIMILYGFGVNWKGEIDDEEDNCSLGVTNGDFWYYPVRYGELMFIVIPVLLVTVLYTHMWLKARHHIRGAGMEQTTEQRQADKSRQVNLKAVVTFLIVTTAFSVAWAPAATRKLYKLITGNSDTYYTEFIARMAMLTNSWLNLFIYYMRNSYFRETAKRYFRLYSRCCRRATPVVNPAS
ncbi:alpha-1A adrenergic receptor-like [Asterias rubens]|uniref:alpha-1A adrenergic receptor-like n=1 Tax=Asterias rubens TaxID=7604 RepID=UPI001455A91B|nr:alpha-1A adrenergic receptor-like [Asterias rubens]